MTVALIEVISIQRTSHPDRLECVIKVDAGEGEEEWPFTYVADDTAPMTLAVRQWMAEHPDPPIEGT